jgi:hypothetical protein
MNDITNKKIRRLKFIIPVCFLILVIVLSIYSYIKEKSKYQEELNKELKGIVTKKYRVQENNPKAVNVNINDSIIYYLPFSLIAEITIGDTVKKKKGDDYYIFSTQSSIIKFQLSKPHLWGYPKNWRGNLEIEKRK